MLGLVLCFFSWLSFVVVTSGVERLASKMTCCVMWDVKPCLLTKIVYNHRCVAADWWTDTIYTYAPLCRS